MYLLVKTVKLKTCGTFNSILWDNVTISSKAKINNSVICNNNIIKEETKAPLGVIIAENCEIGKKVSFEKRCDDLVW